MPTYRVTVRYGVGRYHYHVEDVEAPELARALALAAEHLSPEVAASGEVAEVRRLTEPEAREMGPG